MLEIAQAIGWRPSEMWAATFYDLTTAVAFFMERNNPRPKAQSPDELHALLAALPRIEE